jgi:hypothetical protein
MVSLIGNTPATPIPTVSIVDSSANHNNDENRETPLFNRLVDKLRSWLGRERSAEEQTPVSSDVQTTNLPYVRQLLRLANTSHRGTSSLRENDIDLW